jgi:thiamine-phosphate pyrophosphorylase
VRNLIGPSRLIGLSTHDVDQALAGERAGADYLGVGPTFPSRTKPFSAYAGLPFVREAAEAVAIPWFAIGGIDAKNVQEVREAGGTRVAVSSALLEATSPGAAAREMKTLLTSR